MPSRRMGAPTAYQMDKGIVLEFNDLTRRQALKLMMAAATLAAMTPSVAAAASKIGRASCRERV